MERETSKPATRARADIENQPPMAKSDQVGTRTKITQSRRDREESGPSRDYRQYDRREERPYLAVNRQERDERLQRYEEEDDVSEDEDEDVIQHSDTEVDYRDGYVFIIFIIHILSFFCYINICLVYYITMI